MPMPDVGVGDAYCRRRFSRQKSELLLLWAKKPLSCSVSDFSSQKLVGIFAVETHATSTRQRAATMTKFGSRRREHADWRPKNCLWDVADALLTIGGQKLSLSSLSSFLRRCCRLLLLSNLGLSLTSFDDDQNCSQTVDLSFKA